MYIHACIHIQKAETIYHLALILDPQNKHLCHIKLTFQIKTILTKFTHTDKQNRTLPITLTHHKEIFPSSVDQQIYKWYILDLLPRQTCVLNPTKM